LKAILIATVSGNPPSISLAFLIRTSEKNKLIKSQTIGMNPMIAPSPNLMPATLKHWSR
ncbi:hypothetical protein WICMUC_000578, partial [Wickerhamomyces mucosus]